MISNAMSKSFKIQIWHH